jgi:hypothetical protein
MTAAFDWYEAKRIGLGTEFLDELDSYYIRITNNPEYFQAHLNQRVAVMQRFPYKLIFEVERNLLVVYAVYHHKRDPEKLSERD